MEIKVGEYVRTIDGYIRKVTQVNEKGTYQARAFGKYETDVDYKNSKCISEKKITKHSSNIIDLIEVGDYVNGYKVVDIMEDMKTGELHLEMTADYTNQEIGDCTIYNKNIKTIVTHEQMREMEYKVWQNKNY